MKGIILFDGVCNLCSSSVQFVIKRDPHKKFRFASLQSEVGQGFLKEYDLENDFDSFILLDSEKKIAFSKSTAALLVCKELSGWLKILAIFLILPRFLRDPVYSFIAKRRYQWFGKKEECMLPTPDIKDRFV